MSWVQKWNIIDDFYWYNTTTGAKQRNRPSGVTTPSLEPSIPPPPWAPVTEKEFQATPTSKIPKSAEEFGAEVKAEQERMEGKRQSDRIVEAGLGVIPKTLRFLDSTAIVQAWAKGTGDLTELTGRIWNELEKPYLEGKSAIKLSELRDRYTKLVSGELERGKPGPGGIEPEPVGKKLGPGGIKLIDEIMREVGAEVAAVKIPGMNKAIAEIAKDAALGTDPNQIKQAAIKANQFGIESLTESERKLVEDPRIKGLSEDIRDFQERQVALRLMYRPDKWREEDVYLSGIGAGLNDKVARRRAKNSEQGRFWDEVQGKSAWEASLTQARDIVVDDVVMRARQREETESQAEIMKAVKARTYGEVTREVGEYTGEELDAHISAERLADDLIMGLYRIGHEMWGIPYPVFGSLEAELDMENLKSLHEVTVREIKNEEMRDDFEHAVYSQGYFQSAFLAAMSGLFWLTETTEHLYFAVSKTLKYEGYAQTTLEEIKTKEKKWTERPGLLEGGYGKQNQREFQEFRKAWEDTGASRWDKDGPEWIFYPLYLTTAYIGAMSDKWDLAKQGEIESDLDVAKSIVRKMGDKNFRKEMRENYGEDYAQFFFDLSWAVPSIKTILGGARIGLKVPVTKLMGLMRKVEIATRKVFPKGARAFDLISRGGARTRDFFKIKPSDEQAALEAFDMMIKVAERQKKGLPKRAEKLAVAIGREEAMLRAKTGDVLAKKLERLVKLKREKNLVDVAMAGIMEASDRGYFGRKAMKIFNRIKKEWDELDNLASEKALWALGEIPDKKVKALIDHIDGLGDIKFGKKEGKEALVNRGKMKLSKDPEIIETAKRVKELTEAGYRKGTPYKHGYFPRTKAELIPEVWETGWRKRRTLEEIYPAGREEAAGLLASAIVRERKYDLIERALKEMPGEGDIKLLFEIQKAVQHGGWISKEQVERFGKLYQRLEGDASGVLKALGEIEEETKAVKKWAARRLINLSDSKQGKMLDRLRLELKTLTGQARAGERLDRIRAFRRVLYSVKGQGEVDPGKLKQMLRVWDTMIRGWKRGELRYSPRWYLDLVRGDLIKSLLEGMWRRPGAALKSLIGKVPVMRGITGETLYFGGARKAVTEMLGGRGKIGKEVVEETWNPKYAKLIEAERKRLKGKLGIKGRVRAIREVGLTGFADILMDASRNTFGKFIYDREVKALLKEAGGRTKREIHEMAYARAKEFVNKVQFDYDALSQFDRIMKRIDPYWVYHSRNIAYFIDLGLRKPYKPVKINQVWRTWEENSVDKKGGIQVMGWIVPVRPLFEFRHFLTDINKGRFRDPPEGRPLDWFIRMAATLGFSAWTPYSLLMSHPRVDAIDSQTWKSIVPLTFIPDLFYPGWEREVYKLLGYGDTQKDRREWQTKKEMARQIARGDKPDIEKAERAVDRIVTLANIYSWMFGTTPKYHPAEDIKFEEWQKTYLTLPLAKRQSFVESHPEIKAYWAVNDRDELDKPITMSEFIGRATEKGRKFEISTASIELERIKIKYEEEHSRLKKELADEEMLAAERAMKEMPRKEREAFLSANPKLRSWLDLKSRYRELQEKRTGEIDAFLEQNPTLKEELARLRVSPEFYGKFQKAKDYKFWSKAPDPVENYESWVAYVRGTVYWGADKERGYQRYLSGKAKWTFWSGAPDPRKNYLAWVGYVRGTEYWTGKFEAGFQRYLKGQGQKKFAKYLAWKPYFDLKNVGKTKEAREWLRANKERLKREGFMSDTRDEMVEINEGYWALPKKRRKIFLEKHPELVEWWHRNDTEEETLLRKLIDKYYSLPKTEKQKFLATHPKLKEYWENRKRILRSKTMEEYPEIATMVTEYKKWIEKSRQLMLSLKRVKGVKESATGRRER